MLFKHNISIAQQLMTTCNNTVHKNKSNASLNMAKLLVLKDTKPTCQKSAGN